MLNRKEGRKEGRRRRRRKEEEEEPKVLYLRLFHGRVSIVLYYLTLERIETC
jgi:hypothetical protein